MTVRALLVNDAEAAQMLLAAVLQADDDISVVGVARDGVEAVAMARRLQPDVVIMDIFMPRLDGVEATKRIMSDCPAPVVVVSASRAIDAARRCMDAVKAGAVGILESPLGPRHPDFDRSRRLFADRIKAYADVQVVSRRPPPLPPAREALPSRRPVGAVGIVASTGGPAALETLLRPLPADFPAPIFVVQHMAPGFLAGLAAWLDDPCALTVRLAREGEVAAPGTVYVAPEDRHLQLRGERLGFTDGPPVGGFRPSADPLLESLATTYGASAVGIALTGMGRDGVAGLLALRQAGGFVIAQDPASCVVHGIPQAAMAAGATDAQLPLADIAPALLLRARLGARP